MNKQELVNILNILKNDKGEQKGFSFRRTIKTLQEAKKKEPIMEFWENLQGKGEQKDGDGN